MSEHRFELELTDGTFGGTSTRTYRAAGVAGGVFAGYDLPVTSRLRLGVEAAVTAGGGSPVARTARGSYREDPQWGYRIGGRAGYVIGDRAVVYGAVGYGAQRADFRDGIGVDGADRWSNNISYGSGAEFRLSRHVGLRRVCDVALDCYGTGVDDRQLETCVTPRPTALVERYVREKRPVSAGPAAR